MAVVLRRERCAARHSATTSGERPRPNEARHRLPPDFRSFHLANRLRLSRELHEQRLERVVVGVGRHRRLLDAQLVDLILERELVLVERRELRIVCAAVVLTTAVEEEPPREHAFRRFGRPDRVTPAFAPMSSSCACSVCRRRVVVVHALRLGDRIAECLEQRHASVLVRVGDVLGERVDEELARSAIRSARSRSWSP